MKTTKYVSQLVSILVAIGATLAVNAQTAAPPPPPGHPPAGHPALTKDQMDCLHKTLGPPSKTNRPSPQKMQEAFKTCKIQMPGQPPGK